MPAALQPVEPGIGEQRPKALAHRKRQQPVFGPPDQVDGSGDGRGVTVDVAGRIESLHETRRGSVVDLLHQVVEHEADGDPTLVRRIMGRFRSMVLMPSTISVRLLDRVTLDAGRDAVCFDVLTEQGGPAIDGGVVVLGEPG